MIDRFPNSLRSQVMTQTLLSRWAAQRSRRLLRQGKQALDRLYNSGKDIATTRAVSEVDEKSELGMLASLLLTQEKDKCEPKQHLSL